nr:MAG TPA: Spherulation-specific family 4 [Caudoviricetes sp.]
MADLTWYSREGADSRFLTKQAAQGLATESARVAGDAALGQRIDAVSATAGAALPRTEAAATYATKEALVQAQLGGGGQSPDLSAYATKNEVQSADTQINSRIDSLSSTVSAVSSRVDAAPTVDSVTQAARTEATAAAQAAVSPVKTTLEGRIAPLEEALPKAATKAELAAYQTTEAAQTAASQAASQVAETYATKAALDDYLPKTEAAGVYATKSDLANAQLGGKGEAPDLSHLATKAEMDSADTALGQRIDAVKGTADAAAPLSALTGYVTTTSASATYETKTDAAQAHQGLSGRIDSLSTSVQDAATKSELADYLPKADAQTTYATKSEVEAAKPDLTTYATKESLSDYLPKTDAESIYAKASDFSQHVADADGKFVTRNELTETYSTKQELRTYSASAQSAFAPASLSGEVASVKETADAALPKDVAAITYATKDELTKAQLAGDGKIPDLSGYVKTAQLGDYARKTDLDSYAKTTALSAVSTKADAALPKAEAATTYATLEAVTEAKRVADAALPRTEAAATYTTRTDFESFKKTPGAKGPDGDRGPTGPAGPAGPIGPQGPRGPEGPRGAAGEKGQDGAKGLDGAAGPAGPRGPEGPAGPQGAKGPDGAKGADGAKGLDGAPGPAGPKGPAGDAGPAGAPGEKGAAGETGPAGPAGPAGPPGPAGPKGPAGDPGELTDYAKKAELQTLQEQIEALIADQRPFKAGQRYSSPVTYYWPDYYNESKGTSKWARALKAGSTLGLVILNKDSGNWDQKNEDFGKQAARALSAGAKRCVFYVKTQYGVASLPPQAEARRGVPNPDKYTKEYILGQIAKFTEQYGDVVGGVFLDEVINGWGAQASRVGWYKDLIDSIRSEYGKGFYIVVNAGSNMSQQMCGLDFDTAMMFEQDAQKFLNEDPGTPILPDHMKAYPSDRWWVVIHGVTKDNYRQVFEKLDTLPIGHAYITDGVLVEDQNHGGQWEPVGNPYENPPSEQLIRLTSSWIRGTLDLNLTIEDLKAQIAELKKNGGGAGKNPFLVLGPNDPVPAGTANDTVIIRREG